MVVKAIGLNIIEDYFDRVCHRAVLIFEHSLSLEKFLRQAKADHRQAKAELQARVDQEKKLRKEINLKSVDKYMSLLKQYRLLQSQHEELTNECNTLRLTQLKGLEVKRKLESAVQTVRQELELLYVAKEKEMQSLKSHSLRLEGENDRLQKQNMELATHVQDLANHPNLLEKNINQCNHKITELKKSLMRCQIDLNRHAELKTVKVSKRPATKEKGKVQNIPSPSPSPIAVIPEEVNVQDSKEKSKQGASGKVPSSSPNPVAFSLSFTAFQDVNFEQLQSKTDQMLNKSLQNSHLQQAK
ncbi:Golgi integral membrane protein 4-like [Anabrus simplex]|uniref:Golgi integral membrane protein 4-like n=1 Tax=Anabrus simplex TaxID=316456 RepID=UPI0035A2CBD1